MRIKNNNTNTNTYIGGGGGKKHISTFLGSGLGVPSTLLFIFWAGFILSMPNSGLGAIPGGWGVIRHGYKINNTLSVYKTVLWTKLVGPQWYYNDLIRATIKE